ncbi:MAG TPA: thioesterase family protein [Streptosporangiaceae bacterium]|nr:thioesterase family protein [Streptosporangiaceae bacterium]
MSLLATGGRTVPPEWIDYIGHMMDAYYFLAFTEATEVFLDYLGLGEGYRAASGCGMYTVESHLCFGASVREGAVLTYDSQLLGEDAKRLHVFHRMSVSPSGTVAATGEFMFLHVNIHTERVVPMPSERWKAVSRLAAAHAGLATPASAGRRVQLHRS